jgi:hypothetical protein
LVAARPGLLASTLFHVVLLVLLGLITQRPQAFHQPTVVTGAFADSAETLEPHVEPDPGPLEMPLESPLSQPQLPDPADTLAPAPAMEYRDMAESVPGLNRPLDPDAELAGKIGGGSAGSGKGEGQGAGGGDGKGGAEFFGVKASGDTFVFIVDSSMSMMTKVQDARKELEYAIRRLSPKQRFYVIFFDQNTEFMHLGTRNEQTGQFQVNPQPETDLVPATSQNVDAFVRWMLTIKLQFATNPYEAVVFAINELKPDAIYLLSDGEFTDHGQTEQFLRQQNVTVGPDDQRRPKSAVHCIGFYSRRGEIALKRIAEANGGTYRFVEPPPGYVPWHRRPGARPRGVARRR